MQDLSEYSAVEFQRLDPAGRALLAQRLAEVVTADFMEAAAARLESTVDALNALGHELRPTDATESSRNYNDERGGPRGLLRLAADLVISTGYADMITAEEADEAER